MTEIALLAQRRAEWRARREARRAKQREQNVHRAAAMNELRVAAECEGVFPIRSALSDRNTIHVGCSGWYYWHWRDCFYPQGSPSSRWFDYYASQFDTVELNAPFYSWPTRATVETWKRQAGRRRFVYSVKVNELITHTKRFAGTKSLVRDFYHIANVLGPRLGCFLFQLPPSFHYSSVALRRIVTQLDPVHRNVVEFRHRSWWNNRVFDALRDAGLIFCSTSGPRLPDQVVKTHDEIYIHFHGITRWYRHDYTRDELKVWADRIAQGGATRVWAYFNNDREGYAIKNARMLLRQLSGKTKSTSSSKRATASS